VDDIRELRENIRYLPSRSRYKIFIIDEVHMLSINAFNALLKTLEEPPEHAKFIFATTEPHKIPITILSRCQRFDFRKIALPLVVTRLRQIAEQENVRISERSLALVARRGEGSMRDALSTFDQVIAFCGDEVADKDVQGLLGMVDRRLLLDTVEGVLKRDGRRVLEAVCRVDDLGHSFRQFCRELLETFRALVILKVVHEPGSLLEVTPDELEELERLSSGVELEDLQRVVTLLVKAEAELAGSPFPRLTLEMTLVRLSHLPPGRDVASLLRKVEDLERRLAGDAPAALATPAVSPNKPASAEASEPPRDMVPPAIEPPERVAESQPVPASPPAGAERDDWPRLVQRIKQERPRIGSLLEHGRLLRFELPAIDLGFVEGSFHFNQMQNAELRQAFKALADDFFGQSLTLKIIAVDEGAAASGGTSLAEERRARESGRRNRLREEALALPAVQAARKVLEAEVVEVKALNATDAADGADMK
jgi:DNA polymerase-3 subunit gamma/tau